MTPGPILGVWASKAWALGALAVAALCATATIARAEDGALLTGTLKVIQERGTILIGHRDDALPFSFLNKAGQPVGFSVDICQAIASDIAAALHRELLDPGSPSWRQGIRIEHVPVVADTRLPKVVAGEVDLECGSTTATSDRAKTVAFSPVFFLAGTKLMTPATSGMTSYRDLAGKAVVVGAGTTNGEVMRRLAPAVSPPLRIVEAPDLSTAYSWLAAGKADAFASDDILLAGLNASRSDRQRFRIMGEYLSFEPYAIVFRRDDADFDALVRGSFGRLAREGTLTALYDRWFTGRLPTGETLGLPMSPHLSEMFRILGAPD